MSCLPAIDFVADTHDHQPDAPTPTLAGSMQPTPFALAYPAPWRIQGTEVVDADGCHVNGFEAEDPDEVAFWRGVCLAINVRESLVDELKQARLYVAALARRAPEITAIQDDLARIDLTISQAGV